MSRGSFFSSSGEAPVRTNATTETKATRPPQTPPREPGSNSEPGFSFFPPVVGTVVKHSVDAGLWILYLLLVILAGLALYFKLRSSASRLSKPGTGSGSE